MDKITFCSKGGLKLVGTWHLPDKPTSKAIMLVHGLTADKDESGIFIELGEKLKENSFSVFRFDLRGHGESEGNSVNTTIKKELSDVDNAIHEVISKGYTNIGLLGASFGGSITTLYAVNNQNKLKCLCLWNPVLNFDHFFLNPISPWVKEQKERIDKEFVERGWATIGSRKFAIGKQLVIEMKTLFPYKELKNITIPIIIIHGTKDTKVSFEDSKEYVRNLKSGTFIKIEGAEHGFHEESYQNQVINLTLDFFKKNL